MTRVLVTGASGFVGRPVVAALAARGHEVHGTVRRAVSAEPAAATLHRCDLLEPGAARALVERVEPEALVHLAWYAVPGRYWTAPENAGWLRASTELVAAFAARGGARAVVAGTCAEYDWAAGTCREDATPLAPRSPYATAKRELHRAFDELRASTGLRGVWAHLFFQYGPHEARERLVPSLILALLRGETAVCRAGSCVRDFLYIDDVADALAHLVESDFDGACNLGSGEPVTLGRIAERVGALVGRPDRVEVVDSTADQAPVLLPDVERLRERLGWRPTTSLDDGLETTIRWWRTLEDNPR